jgi:hypothetical protein
VQVINGRLKALELQMEDVGKHMEMLRQTAVLTETLKQVTDNMSIRCHIP